MPGIHPATLLLALLGGAGVLVSWVAQVYEAPVRLSETQKLFGDGEGQLTLAERLQQRLDQARFHLSVGEFLRVSFALAVLAGLGVYLLTGAGLPAAVGALIGGGSYWFYLEEKARRADQDYDDQMPQVVARLITGAQLGEGIPGAAEHVAKFGPLNAREDWEYIASQTRMRNRPEDLEQIFRSVSERRASALLNAVCEMLLIAASGRGRLSEQLPRIQESLEQRTRLMREARQEMNGPIRNLFIVCLAPFLGVLLMRYLAPVNGEAYSAPLGQVIVFGGWTLTAGIFLAGYQSLNQALQRELNFQGGLRPEARPLLMSPAGQPGTPDSKAKLTLPGEAPAALAGVVRRAPPPPPAAPPS